MSNKPAIIALWGGITGLSVLVGVWLLDIALITEPIDSPNRLEIMHGYGSVICLFNVGFLLGAIACMLYMFRKRLRKS